ncbi:MAG: hypothetical protein MPJ78_11975 [Hyphomicrobiaceae bacterium]|nr:hypothetical protein [Hyphomicrobiaceae bacterium]
MSTGAVTEILYHFAGYLHTLGEASRIRIEYEEYSFQQKKHELELDAAVSVSKRHELEELSDKRIPFQYSEKPALPLRDVAGDRLRLDRPDPLNSEPYDFFKAPLQLKPAGFPLTVTVSAEVPEVAVSFKAGGGQAVSQVQQVNYLVDNDRFGIPDGTTAGAYDQGEIEDAVLEMKKTADAETPEDLAITEFDAVSLGEVIANRNAESKQGEETSGGQVDAGTYVNGVLLPEGGEVPEVPDKDESEAPNKLIDQATQSDIEAVGQIAETGGNVSANVAGIVDVNHTTGTMAISGDFHSTDAIVQVTVLMDDDDVIHAGYRNITTETHANEMNNVAKLLETDIGMSSFAGSNVFAGLEWNVDVFDGDLYDVHAVTQSNWLHDNDVVFQENTASTVQVFVGDNGQFNVSTLESWGGNYDLVVVNGDYHQANLIYQKIVLFDADTVKVLGNGVGTEGPDIAGPAISTGENWLQNDATINNFATGSINDLSEDWEELIGDLGNQPGVMDLFAGVGIPNFGDESFDVLVIGGNYYDINVINQEIVVADADTVMQFLPGEGETGGDVVQSAETGGNILSNLAVIETTGPVADYYVGGDHYDDEILIQVEILVSDDDDIVQEDPDALATELAVFASLQTDDEDETHETFLPVNDSAGSDMLGGVLT